MSPVSTITIASQSRRTTAAKDQKDFAILTNRLTVLLAVREPDELLRDNAVAEAGLTPKGALAEGEISWAPLARTNGGKARESKSQLIEIVSSS